MYPAPGVRLEADNTRDRSTGMYANKVITHGITDILYAFKSD